MTGRGLLAIGLGCVIILAGGWIWFWYGQTSKPTVKPAVTHTTTPPAAPAAKPVKTGPSYGQLQQAFIAKGSGDGIESALIRQLVAWPEYFGFTGDTTDAKAVRHWANHTAAVIAIEDGKYYSGIGDEIRTYGDVAYVLDKGADGKLQVAEYVVTTQPATGATVTWADKTLTLATSNSLATSIGTSHFSGASATTGAKLPVPPYEYVYFPHASQ